MKKYSWFIPLTHAQFDKLSAGLKSQFHNYLVMAIETVKYNEDNNQLTIGLSPMGRIAHCPDVWGQQGRSIDAIRLGEISAYINGFFHAIKS